MWEKSAIFGEKYRITHSKKRVKSQCKHNKTNRKQR